MSRFYEHLNAATFRDRAAALERFQEWERTQPPSDLEPADAIAAIGLLYDLLPPASRQRPENAAGVQQMHRALAALSRHRP